MNEAKCDHQMTINNAYAHNITIDHWHTFNDRDDIIREKNYAKINQGNHTYPVCNQYKISWIKLKPIIICVLQNREHKLWIRYIKWIVNKKNSSSSLLQFKN